MIRRRNPFYYDDVFYDEMFLENVILLIKPRKIKDISSYGQLCGMLKQYFNANWNVRAQRLKFWSRYIQPNKTINDFANSTRYIGRNCNYGILVDQMLVDKFIFSINDAVLQRELMNEPKERTFVEIWRKAVLIEKEKKKRILKRRVEKRRMKLINS